MSPAKNAQHVVVRFSDSLYKGIDTIREHELVIKEKGSVWFGKVGRSLAQPKMRILNDQIERNITTYLFLVHRRKGGYGWKKATLERVALTVPRNEKSLVPAYYKKHRIDGQSSIWFKVSKISNPSQPDIQKCHVVSSNKPIGETLYKSMYAMFMVYLGTRRKQKTSSRPKITFEEAVLDAYEDDGSYEYDEY